MEHYVTRLLLVLVTLNSLPASSQMFPGLQTSNSSTAKALSAIELSQMPVTAKTTRPLSCGVCQVGGPNVDVYYWPQANPNTSCLSIIGPTPSPPLAGATMLNGATYWGYTTMFNGTVKTLTTMLLTTINGITFKMPLTDPWPDTNTFPIPSDYTLMAPIGKRTVTEMPNILDHRAPFNESQGSSLGNDTFPAGTHTYVASTVVYNGHTLTSPSIYVDFYSLTANDLCGTIGGGPNGVIKSTLIAFTPGELSTFAAPLDEWLYGMQPGLTSYIVPYNFADLPCPPYKTMTDQWYKPERGLPYRPILAFPSKVLDVDPLWKSCTPGLFTGLDPPSALQPATALVPVVTPIGGVIPKPVPVRPSPSPEKLPKNTAKPVAKQAPPARSTAMPDPAAVNDPVQNGGESQPQSAGDPETLMGNDISDDQRTDVGSASIEARIKSGDSTGAAAKATQKAQSGNPADKTSPHVQPVAGVESNASPEDDSPNLGENSQTIPSKIDNANTESDGSSKGNAVSPTDGESPQNSLPIATVAGEPIVAVPQQPSSQVNSESGPDPKSGEDPISANDNNNDNNDNEPGTNRADTINDPANIDPNYVSTAVTKAPTNFNPAATPAPFTTTINQHIIKGFPSSNLIVIDGHTITRGQGPATISSTPIALQNNGDLIIGTSSVKNLLPTIIPSGDQNPTAALLPNQAPHPPLSPQIYRVGTARFTADGPAITYAGTKIQALADGAVVVGDRTYSEIPTPIAAGMPSAAAGYPVVSEPAVYDVDSSGSTGVGSQSQNSTTLGSATNVVAYYGNGRNEGVCWTVLVGAILIGVICKYMLFRY